MKKSFLVLIMSVLLTACAAQSTANSGNSRRTPVAQISVQTNQSQAAATAQSSVSNTSTPQPLSPTSTPIPSITPAATADASLPADLDVVSSQGYAMNDGFYIVGELLNNTASPQGNVKITATYYYLRAGKSVELGTLTGATLLDIIPAYGKAPFVIGPYLLNSNKTGPVAWYDLHEAGQNGTLPRQDLVVQSGSNSYSSGSWLYVRGEIQNEGTTNAKFVKAVITLYNPDGTIIGAISTYTNPSTIPAGGYAPFSVSTQYWPNFDHFTVQVQAQ